MSGAVTIDSLHVIPRPHEITAIVCHAAARNEPHARMRSVRETLHLRFGKAGDMAGSARLQQGADHRAAERTGPASHDDVTITKVHESPSKSFRLIV